LAPGSRAGLIVRNFFQRLTLDACRFVISIVINFYVYACCLALDACGLTLAARDQVSLLQGPLLVEYLDHCLLLVAHVSSFLHLVVCNNLDAGKRGSLVFTVSHILNRRIPASSTIFAFV